MSEPAQIPTGTVTLLFTDIEGSTRLWDTEPELMAAALRRHDAILRGCIEQAAGYVFKTVGDAFCAAFSAPQGRRRRGARGPAGDRRASVADEPADPGPDEPAHGRVRGTGRRLLRPGGERTARLEAVAHGGQVLLSGATAELLVGDDGVTLTDLGRHRLKDLGRPEQVFQLAADELPASFPPLASLDNPELPNNLPTAASAFVGRERELASVRELITTERMVTLAGAGGSGKTRLALQAAAELTGWAKDGVWLAELAAVTDSSQIAPVVAAALTLPGRGETPPMTALLQALAGQDALLVLDNCEHLVDEAAKFCDEVVRHCPRVRILGAVPAAGDDPAVQLGRLAARGRRSRGPAGAGPACPALCPARRDGRGPAPEGTRRSDRGDGCLGQDGPLSERTAPAGPRARPHLAHR